MNRYSDNLKAQIADTVNLQNANPLAGEYCDFTLSDNCMFVCKVSSFPKSPTVTRLNLEIWEQKKGIGGFRKLFEIIDILPDGNNMPEYYAVNVKAEDLSLNEGYNEAKLIARATGINGDPINVTIINIENSDHLKFEGMGFYHEVFDRMHLVSGA